MKVEKVELSLYTAMNEYNKRGDDFNKEIINYIEDVVSNTEKELADIFKKINIEGADTLISKYYEILLNCSILSNDLSNIDKINNLKRSIEELNIIEVNMCKEANDTIRKLFPY